MNFNTENMVVNEIRKAALLITEASRLGMDLGGYGEIDVNQYSGNVYLWLEDYPFALYIGLGSDKIIAVFNDPETGDEEEREVTSEDNAHTLTEWTETL
jgi:hypothetical protein